MSVSVFSVCLLACAVCADQREIKAKPGHDVTLHCQSPRDADITLLKWSRADLKKDGYVFFFRDGLSNENYQHPTVRGRVQLRDASSMKDGDVSVILKNVTVNDTGRYECLVLVNSTEPEFIDTINLTVTDSDNTAGNTWTEGDEDGRAKDKGKKDLNIRVVVGVSVAVLLLLLGFVGLCISTKCKSMKQNSYQWSAERSGVYRQ